MNAPDREVREVREWLRRSTPTPPDAERSVDEVMTTLFRSTQLRPRVSSHLLGRRGSGEGGFSMFSALKFGVATALVAMVGVLAVSLEPPQEQTVPGAAASAAAEEPEGPAVAVTGKVFAGSNTSGPTISTQEAAPEELWSGYVWEHSANTDDPRLNGTFEFHQEIYRFLENDMYSGVLSSGTGRITNDGGSWSAEASGFAQPGKYAYHNTMYVVHLTGEGGYEGLSAMLTMTPVPGSHWDVEGIVFPGQLPEMPAPVEPA